MPHSHAARGPIPRGSLRSAVTALPVVSTLRIVASSIVDPFGNIPVGIAVVVLTLAVIPGERVVADAQRLDVAGAVTVTGSFMSAVYAIVNGNEVGWLTSRTLGLLVASAALLAVFLVIESNVRSPLVPLRLFRLRNIAVSNVVGVLWAGAMFAWFFLTALYLQRRSLYGYLADLLTAKARGDPVPTLS
jgi:hypothetical protein